MDLVKEARTVYDDSISLYKKSILLHKFSKKASKKKPCEKHSKRLKEIHKEYEDLLKKITKHIKNIKGAKK